MESFNFSLSDFKGRNRRLLHEWQKIETRFAKNPEIEVLPLKENNEGLPIAYCVKYHILSFCGVKNIEHLGEKGESNLPLFDFDFTMSVKIPENFPDVDGAPIFQFDTLTPDGLERNTPWHPNIRFFGVKKGLVCLNRTDTFSDIADSIVRISDYLKYKLYHAELSPPFPEDLQVAEWVRNQAEPNGWLDFKDRENHMFYER